MLMVIVFFSLFGISKNAKAATEDRPIKVIAKYNSSEVSEKTLAIFREIAATDNTVDLIIKDNIVTIERLYPNESIRTDGTTITTPFTASFIQLPAQPNEKIINFKSWIDEMDVRNGQTSVKSGSVFVVMTTSGGGYSGQYDGEKVKTGAHVHCNRFNGTKSDHRYWKKSNPKAWIDFYHSDCDYHASKYGCADFGNMSKCDGLDKRGKGVKDCSSWSGNPKHKNWPKTCWYRK
ncbi:hypothetical protein [Lactobacillus delbrueckii]|uniref:hypothetical protein n=1 Tax=Lactobacillus delbrueckii TaxID=1584 RepID=UPI001E4D883F|nr:hypothetical protein [Lactobacillus delbrueckii]MCD5514615.1 hypothetical protein [Lactobacillus delbrueckii subsp. lactis]MCT3501738.1 hypothetical protein [Lactobacillus delbrueckii subsp. lactis]